MLRNGFVFRLIGVLLLVALMIGGGFMAYKAGVVQGVSQAPAVATAIAKAAENGQGLPAPQIYEYGYRYSPGFYPHHHFGFFPFGGICASILFLFFFLGLMKMVFFRPWHMGWGHYGPWRGEHGHPWGGPPWMRHEGGEGDKKEETPAEKK